MENLEAVDLECVKESTGQARRLLIKKLTDGLSRSECLNGSFLLREGYEGHGVDLERAQEFFDGLKDLPEKKAIETAVKHLIKNLSIQSGHGGQYRFYLILPLCHVLNCKENYVEVTYRYTRSLFTLKKSLKENLYKWLEMIEKPFFRRILKMYKNALSHLGSSDVPYDRNEVEKKKKCLHLFVFMMCDLHNINRSRSKQVNYRNFQVPGLMKQVNIETDYFEKIYGMKGFFFSNNLFLYDVKSKYRLLQCQNLFESSRTDESLSITVSRDRLIQSTKEQLEGKTTRELSSKLEAFFVGEIDYSNLGVKRQLFKEVFAEILKEDNGLFCLMANGYSWFNPEVPGDRSKLETYQLFGKLCALAIFNNIEIHVPFPRVFFKKMLHIEPDRRDLQDLDQEYHRNLTSLEELEENELEETGLELEIEDSTPDGCHTETVDVTIENLPRYIKQKMDKKMNRSVHVQFEQFMEGFRSVSLGKTWKSFFAQELKELMNGSDDYDFKQFEKNTTYLDGYTAENSTVKLFWQVFNDFSVEEKKQFFDFLRGTDILSLHGMETVKMKISPFAQEVDDREQDLLPKVATCGDYLFLPRYTSYCNLKERLTTGMSEKTFQRIDL